MEIWIPELVVVLCVSLPLFRPFIKKLWYVDGLMWLPLVALIILVGIFPAYGFRPECLPMALFALVLSIVNIVPAMSGASSRFNNSFRHRRPLLTICAVILLSGAALSMFAFASKINTQPKWKTEAAEVTINGHTGNYYARIYGDIQADRPLIFLVPPEIGSASSVDLVCRELQKNNYTVVSYFYRDNYPLKRYLSFPVVLLERWCVFRKGTVFASVNRKGKKMEDERRTEVEWILSRLPWNGDMPPLLLVGYGAGGSALAYLAGEHGFTSRYAAAQGVVAIESRLWSSYLPEIRNAGVTRDTSGRIMRYWMMVVNRVNSMRPQRVIRKGPLPASIPDEESSGYGLPVLYLVSGRAPDAPQRQKPYQAVFDALRSGSGPVAIAAIEGAGPLDYQDYPLTHPLYSFLLPGRKGAQQSDNPISDTAYIIGNFMSLLLEQAGQKQTVTVPPRHAITGSLYVESRGIPKFRL